MNLSFESFLILFFGSLTAAILIIAIIIFTLVCLGYIFKKAGIREGFAAVPFYNLYLLFKISDLPGWFFVFLFIPVVGVVFYIIQCIYLSRRFDKDPFFALGLIIFPIIFIAILGLSKTKYIDA